MYIRNIINKDRKIVSVPVDVVNYKSLEKYLENQARKGLIVDEIKKGIITFIKGEPQEKKYFVRLFKAKKNIRTDDDKFHKNMKEIGYKRISAEDPFHIYEKITYHEYGGNIEEDDKDILKTIARIKVKELLVVVSILAISSMILFSTNSKEELIMNFITGGLQIFVLLIPVLILLYGIPLCINSVTFFMNSKRVARGDSMEFRPYLSSIITRELLILIFGVLSISSLVNLAKVSTILIIFNILVLFMILAIIYLIVTKLIFEPKKLDEYKWKFKMSLLAIGIMGTIFIVFSPLIFGDYYYLNRISNTFESNYIYKNTLTKGKESNIESNLNYSDYKIGIINPLHVYGAKRISKEEINKMNSKFNDENSNIDLEDIYDGLDVKYEYWDFISEPASLLFIESYHQSSYFKLREEVENPKYNGEGLDSVEYYTNLLTRNICVLIKKNKEVYSFEAIGIELDKEDYKIFLGLLEK